MSASVKIPKGWRRMAVGEVRRKTDKFQRRDGTWVRTSDYGTWIETHELVYIRRVTELDRLKEQREQMCIFITRLCRRSYKYGVHDKLTRDAMGFINRTDAVNTPAAKLLRKILSTIKT